MTPESERMAGPEHKGRLKDSERTTRKPLAMWDRLKILLFVLLAFGVLVWANLAKFAGLITLREALDQTVRSNWWILALAGLELLRQIHYVISEHWVPPVLDAARVGRIESANAQDQ
jgi:hypothetical protein